ncbi:MAG: acetate--CoA ligase family protein [Pseudomonadota bacterium]
MGAPPFDTPRIRLAFDPQSAAIIGASQDPRKFGGRALKFCLERGYSGRLYPVNASADEVQGVKAYRTIGDCPEAPDVAVIAVPAPAVQSALEAAADKGAKVAIVYGAHFAEAGPEGRARQDAMVAVAKRAGMRLIGPNCMGVISLATGFVASFTTAPEHHDGNGWPDPGSVSVASQSGAVGIQMFAQLRDRGLGLANWMSTGNQADIDVADCIAAYADDPATKTIAVYMEDASRGEKLVAALERARQAKKPVVILKVGTTPEGGAAAAGHTASLYVEDRVVDDLFAALGVLRARSITELIDLVAACNAGVMPTTAEVAAVSVSGGGAVMISDAAAKGGLTLPAYAPDALTELQAVNSFVVPRNPIDISAPSMANMEITGGHLAWGTDQPPATMVGYISHIPLVPRTRTLIMPHLLALRDRHPEKLIALAANLLPEDRKALVKTGLAVFEDPIAMTEAVAKMVQTGRAMMAPPRDFPAAAPASPVTLSDARTLLEGAGIPVVPETIVSADEAVAMLDDGPLVLKLAAPTLAHRTDVGGVIAGLATEAAVRTAHDTLVARAEALEPDHPEIAVVAAPMAAGVEIFAALKNDPHFGPLLMVGSGGTDAELFDDVVFAKAPVTAADAAAMVARLRVAPRLAGHRGAPPADTAALTAALVALSSLAGAPGTGFSALEINPLMVGKAGVCAADVWADG